MSKQNSSWLHLKAILRHVRLAYSTPTPLRVLLIMMITTLSLWGTALWGYRVWSQQQNNKQNKQLTTHILNQFQRYETVLLGCKSLYIASDQVTIDEWSQYIYGLEITSNYQAVTDIAIIAFENQSEDAITSNSNPSQWQAVVKKRFSFRDTDENELINFDTTDLIRSKLMQAAQENMILCLPTVSTWRASDQSSTMILPLYEKDFFDVPNADRLSKLKGWIAMAVDLQTLIELNENYLLDGEHVSLAYLSPQAIENNHVLLDDLQFSLNRDKTLSTHHMAGGVWAVQISNTTSAQSSIVLILLNSIFAAAVIISLLFSGLLGASISSHQHAMQIIKIKSNALLESEHRTREILDTANEAFFSCNFSGHIVDWSKQAQRLFGYSTDQIIGQTISQTILPPTSKQDTTHGGLRKILAGSPDSEDSGQRIELEARDSNGRLFPIELSIAPMKTNEGFVFNAFAHDIRSRKELQTQLAHAQKLESIGELAAGIAHEINTPTQYVGDNTRFLKDAFDELDQAQKALIQFINDTQNQPVAQTPQYKKLTEEIQALDLEFLHEEIPSAISQTLDGIQRVAEIVRSMKNFAHPGTETKQLSDLNHCIQSTTVVSRNVWKYVSNLNLDLDRNLPKINCTPGEINQVILNLIVNAAHAIEDKQKSTGNEAMGTIEVRTKLDHENVIIEVSDTGNGIPQSIRERVYDPFTTTKQVGRGTGQGLAIARTVIVDKHQGQISFQTEDGVGTTFSIVLPIDSEADALEGERNQAVSK
ncbi:MAG: ATP-binding protein [Phycisphaeraceae bacterium JB051]